jgi:hypothetical protein
MEEFVGCPNWVTILIHGTTILDHWAKSARQGGSLSVRELAMRAGQLERRLDDEIEQTLVLIAQLRQSMDAIHNLRYVAMKATHAFGIATLVYLHVIVSGWNPEASEI